GPAGRAIAGAARRGPHLPHPAEAVLGPWTPAPSGPRAPYLPQPVRGEGVDRRALRVLVARPCPAGSVAVLADRPAPRRPRGPPEQRLHESARRDPGGEAARCAVHRAHPRLLPGEPAGPLLRPARRPPHRDLD